MVAEAGLKLIQKNKKPWKKVEIIKENNNNNDNNNNDNNNNNNDNNNQNKSELEGLMNMGKVTAFKNINIPEDKNKSPLDTIHDIVNTNGKLNKDKKDNKLNEDNKDNKDHKLNKDIALII